MKCMKIIFVLIVSFCLSWNVFAADYYTAATATEQVRMLLEENTNNFFTDTEIGNWIKEATEDISSRALCVQVSDTIALVTGQNEYATTVGAVSVVDMVKVWGCFYISTDNEYIGLKRISIDQIADLPYMIPGPPKYFYHFADKIGILPLPTASESTKTIRIYFSKSSQTIGDLPNQYQPLTFWYAASQACEKRNQTEKAKAFYSKYIEAVTALKQGLYNVTPEVRTQ